jgi:alpha-N-acetylglucosaminidase
MTRKKFTQALFHIICFLLFSPAIHAQQNLIPVKQVLERSIGKNYSRLFELKLTQQATNEFSVVVSKNKVSVSGNSPVSVCRGVYDYLSNACNSLISWSGSRINIPEILPAYSVNVRSPFQYLYYFNVVTPGYTTAYWDWARWEKEIDWMAMHGLDMPLIPGAHEAILSRVFQQLGFTKAELDDYFTGPAHFPWNKMGNINGWDSPLPVSYFPKQVKLTHQVLNRLKELQMHPIVPAFAGFVPKGIQRIYPGEKVRELDWGGFEKKYHAYILEPGSELFNKIGRMYIKEWEKEFGKAEFYLADSFNEMDVPVSSDPATALKELAGYGESVYNSIKDANPEATWVMQGWTFPYQEKDGKLFWTPERLNALVSKVPDNKLLILDLANEYNRLFWKTDPSWKTYDGFFGKKWVYSFIPNMGGKTSFNGRLDMYATMTAEALQYPNKKNLVGFGFAPEGIENNEIIYEMLSEEGWRNTAIDLNKWIEKYCLRRYGAFPETMKQAFSYFNQSCFGSFTDHPKFKYQHSPANKKYNGTVNKSEEFGKGVALFLKSSMESGTNKLYVYDAIEFATQWMGLKADELLIAFQQKGETDYELLDKALLLMTEIDRLLESHPNWKLENWDRFAAGWGDTPEEIKYYSANARRLITTWGGYINEYAAKTWSGLIRDYYIPRWKLYYEARKNGNRFNLKEWEENWIHSTGISPATAFPDPLEKINSIIKEFIPGI